MELDDDMVEVLAAHAHARHTGPASDAYADLDDASREATRDGVRAIPAIVAALGYRIVRDPAGTASELTESEVERGAVLEHERWVRFTRSRGYEPGPARDDEAMTHPDLVPWEQLDEPTREKDRVRVRAIPWLLARVGLHLAPSER